MAISDFNPFGVFGDAETLKQHAIANPPKPIPAFVPAKPLTVTAPELEIPTLDQYFNTSDYANPYYQGTGPVDEFGNKVYERFDYEQDGSGIMYDKNPALAFDQMFGSQYIPRLDIGDNPLNNILSDTKNGTGLGQAMQQQFIADNNVDQNLLDAIAFNDKLDKYTNPKYTYEGLDDWYKDAFNAYGLDADSIGGLEAINALDPNTKANVIDYVARAKQAQNQLPPPGS